VTLEQSITLYTRGKELQEHCEAKLKDAEAKIEKLTLDAKGALTGTEPAEGM
jgi:exodeoxyribonuclease VII small subunit